jgi:hypothetical protein
VIEAAAATHRWAVPRDWTGETCAVLGCGPSLSREVCERLRGRCRLIAVNNAGIDTIDSTTGALEPALAPWADVLYASDAKWWRAYRERAMAFAGLKISRVNGLNWADLHTLSISTRQPFDARPTHLANASNSGTEAIHVAAHFGAARILLFGFDMREVGKRRHYFGSHPPPLNSQGRFAKWIGATQRLAAALARQGQLVINCTPGSALRGLKCSTIDAEFPRPLDDMPFDVLLVDPPLPSAAEVRCA